VPNSCPYGRHAHLDEASRVVTVEVAQDKAALLRDAQLGHAALDELVAGHLLVLLQRLLVRLAIRDAEQRAGPQGVVQLHQRIAPPEGPPQQRHRVGIVVGLVLLLGHPAVEAGDEAQPHLQRQASLEEGGVLVCPLVEHVVRRLHRAAIHRRRRQAGERGRLGEEGAVAGR
jgi:hypothetical protein